MLIGKLQNDRVNIITQLCVIQNMRIIGIIVLVLAVVFVVAQVISSRTTKNTEEHKYEVVKNYEGFEIRKYESALFSYTVMEKGSYRELSGQGFRRLAGYIFGDNDKNQKIAMTTPVTMDMDDSVTMKFMVPKGIEVKDLPKPNNPNVKFEKEPEKTIAAIEFGGWATDEKIAEYTAKLKLLLAENEIEHIGKFSFLGYNPPYEMTNRRNEVVVEVEL